MREQLWRAPLERDLSDEVQFHIEMETAKHIAAGMSPEEARRRALRDFGGADRFKEETRDARRIPVMEEILRDARIGVRQLRRAPGFAAVSILTLALAIGANTAIFSVIDGVLLAPLPLRDASHLVVAWETDRTSKTEREPASFPDFVDYTKRAHTLRQIEAVSGADIALTPDGGDPMRVASMLVTHGYFDLIGKKPVAGRFFTAEDDKPGAALVTVLGESFWRATYAADPHVIGRTVRLNDVAYQIIGVAPQGSDFALDQVHARAAYHGPYSGAGDIDVWAPMQADEASYPRDTHPMVMIARLANGATPRSAQTELASIAADLERTYPVNRGRGIHIEPLSDVVFGPVRPALALLIGAVVLVLLVGCVNVAGLLLARGTARTREVAVRGALGAGTGRLARQFATETLLLALMGGAAGVALAYGGLHALLALAPADIPRVADVHIDARVLFATFGVSVIVGVVFGLVPTLQSRGVDVGNSLREGRSSAGRERMRARSGMVVLEVGMAVVLLIAASLLMRSFYSVMQTDPGFNARGVLKAEFQLPSTRYPRDYAVWPNWTQMHRFNDEVLRRAAAIPGVQSAAVAANHPLDAGFTNSFTIVGREAEAPSWPEITVRVVSPGYFGTMNLPLVRGRAFSAGDDAKAPAVATINKAASDLLFAGREPIGQVIQFWGTPRQIVGVVGNEKLKGLTEKTPPAVYLSTAQAPSSGVLLVRTSGDPSAFAAQVRSAISSVDPQLAVYGVEPLTTTVSSSVAQRRFTMLVVGAFAALAIVLALVGVHGMLSYTTAQRTREFGIRLALGATRGGLQRHVIGGGVRLTAAGVLLGAAGAIAFTRWIQGLLFGVTATDPRTYIAVAACVTAAAAVASWLPARRATRAQALEALRSE
jgi:putative ABC transport system permease protein